MLTPDEIECFLTGFVHHENVFNSSMSLVAINIVKMMFVFILYELSALRAAPVLLLRYLTYIMTHRLHLNQLFSIIEVSVPFDIGRCQYSCRQKLKINERSLKCFLPPDH